MKAASFHPGTFLLFQLCLLGCCGCLFAQTTPAEPVPEALRKHVATIENFINRFNYEEDKLGNTVSIKAGAPAQDFYIRERNYQITALIDPAVLHNPDQKPLVEEFLQQVNSSTNQKKLSLRDKQWFAEVHLQVLYKKRPGKLTMVLQLEEDLPKTYQWAIRAVKADFFHIVPKKTDPTKLIPPNSHGTDFIGLPQHLSPATSIGEFVSREAVVDQLSLFLYAVHEGDLILKQTDKVVFHFLQFDNWIFRVEDLKKNLANSGFLVAGLIKADDAAKKVYAFQQLNIR